MLRTVKEAIVGKERAGEIHALAPIVDERHRRAVALIVVHADFDTHLVGHAVACLERHITGCGKVAFGHVVGAFVKINLLYHLGLQEMQVGISLPVGMAHHIHRHPVDRHVYVGAMVKVKSTQKHLFGLTSAGMLGYEQSRHRTQYLLR